MIKKIQSIAKRILVTVLCITTTLSAVVTIIPIAECKGSSGILGTNAALGSPILNSNFTVDNWNKWEIICWGVFLSNFCQPLIDDYESAFKTGSGGSDGAGYKALAMGSGNDSANNEVIEKYCDYAIAQSLAYQKQIYVGFTEINSDGTLGETVDPNSIEDTAPESEKLRPATFRDLFIQSKSDSEADTTGNGSAWAEFSDGWTLSCGDEYSNIMRAGAGQLPTFYIQNSNNTWIKIWDYTDAWDVQMISAMLNAIRNNTDSTGENYYNQFTSQFDQFWNDNQTVSMDAFGNITINNKMIIPAAINQHLTKTEKINLLNSWVLNSYASTYSEQQMVLGLRQNVKSTAYTFNESLLHRYGGLPAIGESNIGAVGLLYYDMDTIMYQLSDSNSTVNYGDALLQLFNCDINNSKTEYLPKFEVADTKMTSKYSGVWGKIETLDNTHIASAALSNQLEQKSKVPILSQIYTMNGDKINIFSSKPVLVANQSLMSKSAEEPSNQGAVRNYYNWLYKCYSGSISDTIVTKNLLDSKLSGCTWDTFKNTLSEDTWFKQFKRVNTQYKDVGNLAGLWKEFFDYGNNETISNDSNRLILVYPVSETMRAVSQILGVDPNAEFTTYSTMIYMTYLDWYGINNQKTLSGAQDKVSEFNTEIFDESNDALNVDPNAIAETKSDEQKQDEILQMSYLMLHPEDGRDYRKTLIMNGLSDWLYEQYNRIVYGGYSETYSGSASKSNSGFLAVETYADNVLTAWFIDSYVDIAVWIMGICSILIILLGLLKSKKLSWYVLSLAVVVNAVLLVPSSGEIVPYVTSNFVQKMFTNKMNYWAISQGVTNATLEKQSATQSSTFEGLSDDEASMVITLVKQLNNVYTDRSLMVKQDISQKITQATAGSYSDIQSLQSARWVLPMVMQQFTGDNNSQEYVYKSLANINDDLSNIYWYFNPIDAYITNSQSPTATSGQSAGEASSSLNDDGQLEATLNSETSLPSSDVTAIYGQKKTLFADADTDKDNLGEVNTDVNYHCFSYSLHGNAAEQVHLSAYLLPDTSRSVQSRGSDFLSNYEDADSWQTYIDKTAGNGTGIATNWSTDRKGDITNNSSGMSTVTVGFDTTADRYDRTDRNSITPDMSYLLHTENPVYYFYNVVKDTFSTTETLGSLIGKLQGEIEEDAEGNQVRSNFMYATKGDIALELQSDTNTALEYTGYVRDVLDLEELITNTVPYLYEMQITTGGFDGTSGILGDSEIGDGLQYYEGELQSWMYRCNWATKLMESPEYSEACTVRNCDGQSFTVANPMMPECYEKGSDGVSGRPMVFSEAQMEAMELTERDLSLVELKCIEVNKRVAREWTLLINYAGTDGITKEVLMRQMAMGATLVFNDEFSSTGILNTMYTMYPQSLDLRYISFDSVMKMLIMNVSKNTSYIYGSTMLTLINDTDMITASLLMLVAFLCAYIIPFIRAVLMAMIFYLGFVAIIRALFSGPEYKGKVACGQFISNVLFMIYTLAYYAVFAALMAISSSDEVLTTSNIKSEAGNPVWVLIIVLIASGAYIFLMYKQICFCFVHFRDMGYEVYSTMASGIVSKLSDSLGNVGNSISNFFGGDTNYSTSNTRSISGTGIQNAEPQDVNIKQSNGAKIYMEDDDSTESSTFDDNYGSNYNSLDDTEEIERTTAGDIDATIEAGAEMDNES